MPRPKKTPMMSGKHDASLAEYQANERARSRVDAWLASKEPFDGHKTMTGYMPVEGRG